MGTSRSGAELNRKLHRIGKVVTDGNGRKTEDGAELVKTATLALAAPKTGGDLAFSGTGNKKVGVRTKLLNGGVDAKASARATGPMHWLERGVKPHPVAPKGVGGSRALRGDYVRGAFGGATLSFGGRGGFLRFADGGFAKYARRAGRLEASEPWSRGVERAERLWGKDYTAKTVRELASVFG